MLSLANDLSDLIFPRSCPACRENCRDHWICPACDADLAGLAAMPACPKCARPLATAGSPCPSCAGRSLHPFDAIIALGPYRDPLRDLIHHAKFHGQWIVAEHLARCLSEQNRVRDLLEDADVLVPVPLHWGRHISRGYNQADVLAAALSRRCGVPVDRAISRIRRTDPQTTLNAKLLRARNVRGAFRMVRGAQKFLAGKNVVLVDDVMTTGATLRSAARSLKPAAPASISAIVIAVADPRRTDFEMI